jgi:hypothetical protein
MPVKRHSLYRGVNYIKKDPIYKLQGSGSWPGPVFLKFNDVETRDGIFREKEFP